MLQDGGALGSYRAAVCQGLAEGHIHPNWVEGISLGALNAAVIAGNPPERRVARLRAFSRIRETDYVVKEITINRIEHVQCAHQTCARNRNSHTRGPFDSPAPSKLDAPCLGENREVREISDDQLFASHRARLFGIAYRMLGSRADAEDLVQDVYVHWYQSARHNIKAPIAFLVTITTRLCLDRLRELKRQRARYPGPWLPEHVVEDHMPSPEMQLEFSEEVSIGFLAVLERLGQEERAAFLLHDVLDYEYQEVAKILSKTESACRQTIHRARVRLRDPRTRFAVTQESCERILKKFLATIRSGDREAVMASMRADVTGPW